MSYSDPPPSLSLAGPLAEGIPGEVGVRLGRLELLHRVGLALSSERNKDRLLETILIEAQSLCHADGGSLYLVHENKELRFEIVRNETLGVTLGGTSGERPKFPPISLYNAAGGRNVHNVASHTFHEKRPIHIPDAYHAEGFDFSGTKAFDQTSGYRSKSFFTIPLVNGDGQVIGVLQLLNARAEGSGEVIPFREEHQHIVLALASQAAIALDNKLLLEGQKELLESFIKLIAHAIDAKSPYTGGHCERVPLLTEILMKEVCAAKEGTFANFSMSEEEWYELRIAAWLHDCGKVTTPVHVMDKATKLQTISDRIAEVALRYEILERDERISMLEAKLAGENPEVAEARFDKARAELREELAFLERTNIGGEYLPPEAAERIREIGRRTLIQRDVNRPLLDENELENLCISRGTLTNDERLIINGHMVQTIRMLEALPFPRNLRNVPEFAGGHHEKMDGKGYPKGIFAGDMSVPARVMAIADVFEALTADDRPYKKAKKLSEAMRIMGAMKRDNHLDPELFDLFVESGAYRKYAEAFLAPTLIDEVDEAALFAIKPNPFALPPAAERLARKKTLLGEYLDRFPIKESRTTELRGPSEIPPSQLT